MAFNKLKVDDGWELWERVCSEPGFEEFYQIRYGEAIIFQFSNINPYPAALNVLFSFARIYQGVKAPKPGTVNALGEELLRLHVKTESVLDALNAGRKAFKAFDILYDTITKV